MKKISLAFEHEIEYYLFQPIIKQLIIKDYHINILTSERTRKLIDKDFTNNSFNFYNSKLSFLLILLKFAHRIITILFTPHNFSSQYKRMVLKNFIHRNNIWSLFYRLSFITPKSQNINNFIFNCFKNITPDFFSTNNVLVPTLNSYSFLLNNSSLNVFTVMESWDHTMKVPNGYISKKVFLWNENLQNDWREYQKDINTFGIFPLKLRYAIKNKFVNRKVKNKIVYAVASTSLFSNPVLERMEKKIIRDLCVFTKSLNIDFLIKPRPITSSTEFIPLLEEFSHVELGFYNPPETNASNYFLNDDYNKLRFNEIKDAMLVINCFTTFALDSALIGVPVLQLDVSNAYPDSSLFYNNHHIKKYLISSKNILKIENNFKNEFIGYFENNMIKHVEFRKELETWLVSIDSIESSIDKMLKEINS